MMAAHIRLLGEFHFSFADTTSFAIRSSREQALLALLLLRRHTPQRRQQVAFLMWPNSTETQARTNLRRTLHHLRRNLPDGERFLQIDNQSLQWRIDADYTLDVAEFEAALKRADGMSADDTVGQCQALEQAVRLYGGELLPGCYDDWLMSERERLHSRYLQGLEELVWLLEDRRNYRAAIHYAEQLLRSEALREETYRQLLRLHALNGDRAAALRTYHTCVTMLERELGVPPSDDLQEAHNALLKQEAPAPLHQRSVHASQGSPSLVGRQQEWKLLRYRWRSAAKGQAHLVLIVGEAGIGKTRLAEELLAWAQRQGIDCAETRAYSAAGDLAYAPVIEWLRSPPLQASLEQVDPVWLSEVARLLPDLLDQRPEIVSGGASMDSSGQRRRIYEALARTFTAIPKPLLLIIDDLQWSDSETLNWLHYLLDFEPAAPLLIVGTLRTEEIDRAHPLSSLLVDLRSTGQVSEIELAPLDEQETGVLATQVASRQFDGDAAVELYAYTEGNPLYIVETVRVAIDQFTGPAHSPLRQANETVSPDDDLLMSVLPPKVQATIQRRLRHVSRKSLHGIARASNVPQNAC